MNNIIKVLIGSFFISSLIHAQPLPRKASNIIDEQSESTKYWKFKADLGEPILNGTFMLFAERTFSDYFGLEVGLGLTYTNIWYNTMAKETVSGFGSGGTTERNFAFTKIISTNPADAGQLMFVDPDDYAYGLGYAISIFPKIYVEGEVLEGWYVGPQFMFKNYNIEAPSLMNGKMLQQKYSRFNITGNFGKSHYISDLFQFEYFLGIGISFVDDQRIFKSLNNSSLTFSDGIATFTKTRMHGSFGIRSTFCF
jgi:hypothetical protein